MLYREKYFYRAMNKRLGTDQVQELRRDLLAQASGDVLEIGFGSGLNLPCYPDHIRAITAIDVCRVESIPPHPRIEVDFRTMSAETLEFPDSSFTTVVSTFTLCSIPHPQAALREIRRVLKPNGKFLFLEHGKSPNRWVAGLQTLVNPLYVMFACGCNVNRDMLGLIAASGLSIETPKTTRSAYPISGLYFSGVAAKSGALC